MPEDRPTISSSRLSAADVARHSFETIRRGFDPQEVRAYLELVARELQSWEQREQDLRQQLAKAEERARHPVIDEATLTASLGRQSAAVLREAHEEAERIAQRAEQAAAAMAHEAQQRANETQLEAESAAAERIAAADLAAGGAMQQARQDAEAMTATGRAEAEAIVDQARDHGRAMIEQAQEARRRVLEDMSHRRRVMTIQIDQFRAARDELAASVLGVRDSVDSVVRDLSHAEDRARTKAAEVAQAEGADAGDGSVSGEAARVAAELQGFTQEPTEKVEDRSGRTDGTEEHGEPDVPESEAAAPAGVSSVQTVRTVGEPQKADTDPGTPNVTAPNVTEAVEPKVAAPRAAEVAEPKVAPRSPAGASGAAAEGASAADHRGSAGPDEASVEALFARLRASRATDTPTAATDAVTQVDDAPTDEVPIPVVADEASAEPVLEGDELLLKEGMSALEPIAARLGRRVKRALQDDQNQLLDRLRSRPKETFEASMPDEREQRQLYVEACVPALREAEGAGVEFSHEYGGQGVRRGVGRTSDQTVAAAVAEELSGTVVTLLRRRLLGGDAGSLEETSDRIGAAYREWRGERIERLAGDATLSAFSAGVLAGTGGSSSRLRWLVSRSPTACADCDDNGLAGSVTVGEQFPTGHPYPPAHAGCRCMVVPTPE